MQKYELTEETIQVYGKNLYKIRALKDIGENVKKGDLGGFVESEDNLSQEGNCWVSGNAEVYGDARVFGDAWVSGNAEVTQTCTKTPIVISGLNYLVTITDNHVRVGCQCFTLEEWEAMSEEQISELDEGALEFYFEHGEEIKLKARKHMENEE